MVETSELPEALIQDDEHDSPGDEFHSGKIYCANCIHCKLVPARPEGDERYFLRVRCAAGKWRKKQGEEKMYKYCTITRRYLDDCDSYEEMGDTREFLRELKRTIPNKDEQYVLVSG
ncbi:MAG: hypothetical protein LBF74_03790 [Treponema sp.]|jgi:hypothetical protein|nr:hypothetical protein [Treponema sp.]